MWITNGIWCWHFQSVHSLTLSFDTTLHWKICFQVDECESQAAVTWICRWRVKKTVMDEWMNATEYAVLEVRVTDYCWSMITAKYAFPRFFCVHAGRTCGLWWPGMHIYWCTLNFIRSERCYVKHQNSWAVEFL